MIKEGRVVGSAEGLTVIDCGSLYPTFNAPKEEQATLYPEKLCKPTIKPTKAAFKVYINRIYDKKRRK